MPISFCPSHTALLGILMKNYLAHSKPISLPSLQFAMGVSNVSASNHQYISRSHQNTANSIQKNHSRKRQASLRELVQPAFHCQPSELAQGKGRGSAVAEGKESHKPIQSRVVTIRSCLCQSRKSPKREVPKTFWCLAALLSLRRNSS